MSRRISICIAAALALAAPATASAADTLVAPDAAADEITALDGTIVWTSGKFGNVKLMQRTPAGVVGPVQGAPTAKDYRTVDLGRDENNELVLTYLRCQKGTSKCVAFKDNLAGTRASYKNITRKRCTFTTAPSVWRSRIAYGQECRTSKNKHDASRSGLYVKKRGSSAKRLGLPSQAKKFGVDNIESVDLRGERVAAVAADIYEYSYSQSVNGSGMKSIFAAASEGEGDASARGLSLGAGNAAWTLTTSSHTGDKDRTLIFKQTPADDGDTECILGPGEDGIFPATDIASDAAALYLVVPSVGIVSHTFAPKDCAD